MASFHHTIWQKHIAIGAMDAVLNTLIEHIDTLNLPTISAVPPK